LGINIAFGDINLFSLLEIGGVSGEHTDSIFSVLEMLKQHVPSKHRQISNWIHGVIFHLTENAIHFTDTLDILNFVNSLHLCVLAYTICYTKLVHILNFLLMFVLIKKVHLVGRINGIG
jgi:hypothetical protein